jgi:ParB-like chromosome segregation protein Spo0J
MKNAGENITEFIDSLLKPLDEKERQQRINAIREYLFNISAFNKQPIDLVRWVPINKVQANDYNPNSVASTEMKLLYTSISHDGYTQPVVTIFDTEKDKYIIIDGFHRYFICKNNPDILERNHGCLPVVVLEKDINDRMASTVRHNRARGTHSISGMSNMVFSMLQNGWKDEDICNELGMEPEELIKLKHITGFSKLFKNVEYKKAWVTKDQVKIKTEYLAKQAENVSE